MEKPGIHRAAPMGVIGFLLGALIVLVVRYLQNMDPLWDAGVALSTAPFLAAAFFLWGIGAFDPRMSEHAHPPGHDDHAHGHGETAIVPRGETALAEAHASAFDAEPQVSLEEPSLSRFLTHRIAYTIFYDLPRPSWTNPPVSSGFFLLSWLIHLVWFGIAGIWRLAIATLTAPFIILAAVVDVVVWLWRTMSLYNMGVWRAIWLAVVVVIVLFAFALLPTGLRLDTTAVPEASVAANGYFEIQLFGETVLMSQLMLLIIFVLVTMVSLLIVSALLALVFFGLNQGVTSVRESEPTPRELTPPEPVRDVGGALGWLSRSLRTGIPSFFGYK